MKNNRAKVVLFLLYSSSFCEQAWIDWYVLTRETKQLQKDGSGKMIVFLPIPLQWGWN